MAGSEAGRMMEVRALADRQQFADAVRIQKIVWGFEEIELLPVRLFVVATKIGGQAFGAYSGDEMAGFCLALPGLKPNGSAYLHSHMLGVLSKYRNSGVGRILKLRQRQDALARGISLMEWTFDPLEIKNAYFNIERLGAVVRRYVLNQYGTTSSHLHGGLPTDRCVAEWWLDSERVRAVLESRKPEGRETEARVRVPAEIANLRQHNPRRAREIQKRISEELMEAFGSGLAVTGFERSDDAGTYLLGKWQSK